MYSLYKTHARSEYVGRSLPAPFPTFDLNRWTFRHGATSMLAGRPGAFKSVLALNIAITWAQAGKTGMYFAADSDEHEMFSRVASIVTGDDHSVVEASGRSAKYVDAVKSVDRIKFVDGNLSLDGIRNTLDAFDTVHGRYPDFVFLDNLMDYAARSDDWGGMWDITVFLAEMARETQAHACILHHCSTKFLADKPPSMSEIQGQVTQKPRLVLTLGANEAGVMIAAVKNRHGRQDPTGAVFYGFLVEPSLRISDQARY